MIQKCKRVILSSHSMEEVKKLASEVIFLKNGERKFFPEKPKKHKIKLVGNSESEILNFAENEKMSETLAKLEKSKRNHEISDYSIGPEDIEDEYMEILANR